MRLQAWQAAVYAFLLCVLALIALPLPLALLFVVPTIALTIALVRKHGRGRRAGDS
jgi:ABC-type Na+ efflux pump permease subunit